MVDKIKHYLLYKMGRQELSLMDPSMACRRRENGRAEKGPALSCARERRPYAAPQRKPTPAPAPRRRACPVAGAPAAFCGSGAPPWRSAPRRLRTPACAGRPPASDAPAAAVRAARIRLGEVAEVRNRAVLGWREYWGP